MNYISNETIEDIKRHWEDLLPLFAEPAGIRGQYVCPNCRHGSGEKSGTKKGADGIKPYTNSGTALFGCRLCKSNWNIISLYQQYNKCGFPEAVKQLAEKVGIEVKYSTDRPQNGHKNNESNKTDVQTTQTKNTPQRAAQEAQTEDKRPQMDYTPYYAKCCERLKDENDISGDAGRQYLLDRGLSPAIAIKYGIGFDPAADPANAPGGIGKIRHPQPRIIIPWSAGGYLGRCVDDDRVERQYRKMNSKGSGTGIFNFENAFNAQEVIICEAWADALSVIECNAMAVSLNSTSNKDKFVEMLAGVDRKQQFIIALDNDDAGKDAAAELETMLRAAGHKAMRADLCGPYKDINERLQADSVGLQKAIHSLINDIRRPNNTLTYVQQVMLNDIDRRKSSSKKTGFKDWDNKSGGLYSGLYVIAGQSGLGKTSFCLQLADQLAESGEDLLFFSMEQSKLELITKSIARTAADADRNTEVTALKIREGLNTSEVKKAMAAYCDKVGSNVSIIEGNFESSFSFISRNIKEHIKSNGTQPRPVVIIDYLQIIQPDITESGRPEDRRISIDNTVTALKRLSRDEDLTIIVISSLNRSGYNGEFSFSSLKESGGIEYTADCVIGLEFQKQMIEDGNTMEEMKSMNPRFVQLTCIKNRYGADYTSNFNYYPKNDLFVNHGNEKHEEHKPKYGQTKVY